MMVRFAVTRSKHTCGKYANHIITAKVIRMLVYLSRRQGLLTIVRPGCIPDRIASICVAVNGTAFLTKKEESSNQCIILTNSRSDVKTKCYIGKFCMHDLSNQIPF